MTKHGGEHVSVRAMAACDSFTPALRLFARPQDTDGSVARSGPRQLVRLCFDFVVRNVTLCESLAELPLPTLRSLGSLALRRHVCDRRLLRLIAASSVQLDPVDVALCLGFTRNGVRELKRLRNSTLLDLSDGKAGDCRNLATLLPGMDFLQSLNLSHYPHTLSLHDVKAIAGLTNLDSLDMGYTSITDDMLEEIAGMTKLTFLKLRRCRALIGHVPRLAEMNLTHLDMSFTSAEFALPYISKITTLRSLNLSSFLIDSLECLRDMSRLEELNVHDTLISDTQPLRRLTNLRRLDLAYTGVTELEASPHLTCLTNLTHLDLTGLPVRDSFVRKMAERNSGLVCLAIEGTRCKDTATPTLIKSTRPLLLMVGHHVPVIAVVETLRDYKNNVDVVLQALRLLKTRARHGDKSFSSTRREVWTYSSKQTALQNKLRKKTDRQEHKGHQTKRAASFNVDEDGNAMHGLPTEFVDIAEDLLDALYGLLEPHLLHRALLNRILEILRYLSQSDKYTALLGAPRWLDALLNLLWVHPNHAQTVRQTLSLLLANVPKGSGNVYLANAGLLSLVVEAIDLHPGDVCIVGKALEIAARLGHTRVGLGKWLTPPERLATLLRAMREHPRQISVVDPALLLLTLLENQGRGEALVAAGAFHALSQAGASYPKAWDNSRWDRESCVVVNTATLLELLAPHQSVEMPATNSTLDKIQRLWEALRAAPQSSASADLDHQRNDKREANRNRRQKRKAQRYANRKPVP